MRNPSDGKGSLLPDYSDKTSSHQEHINMLQSLKANWMLSPFIRFWAGLWLVCKVLLLQGAIVLMLDPGLMITKEYILRLMATPTAALLQQLLQDCLTTIKSM